ncbi:MAG: class I SAM-dependent methyltransferase, partial [Alcaligenes sp.]
MSDLNGYSIEPHIFLDVPFVPSDDRVIDAMLTMAGTGRDDVLYDLGCGDGRIVIAAAKKYLTHSIGVELDPLRIADAMEQAGLAGVEYMVDFIEEDIFDADFSKASILTLYLMDSINVQLRPRILKDMRP